MNHEQIEFTPPNPAVNREAPPEYAYELERQAGVVQQAQRLGRLIAYNTKLRKRIEERVEGGLKWYWLNHKLKLYSGDCDEGIMSKLVSTDATLTIIESDDVSPDVFFGRQEKAVAAVLIEGGETLYKSPGFDLEAYMQEQSLRQKKK